MDRFHRLTISLNVVDEIFDAAKTCVHLSFGGGLMDRNSDSKRDTGTLPPGEYVERGGHQSSPQPEDAVLARKTVRVRPRSKRKRDFFDWCGLLVLFLTVPASLTASYQAIRMTKLTEKLVYDAKETGDKQAAFTEKSNKFNRETLVANTRAWLAIFDARIEGNISAGNNLKLHSLVKNTGREPARKINFQHMKYFYNTKDYLSREAIFGLGVYFSRCSGDQNVSAGVTSFPSSGSESLTSTLDLTAKEVTNEFVSGERSLISYGCTTYSTAGEVHHTSFCFKFTNGITSTDHLEMCPFGNEAD
ncbi:hypothetical protein [Methylobacterium sp. Leaf125]|uniref:hypothetical protein n=1 Tax=Methylobacterium sp. Leaf125 TaxID=1736265 RepID=UPI000ABA3B3C|nr:hypothetical protein [Methylobacterium sp. Leaf125]